MSLSKKRIAILGAGPSGLAQLRAFASLPASENTPELVCYEKQSDIGGMWNYTWRTGLDKNGEPVHGSMYRYLWSNAPKECLEFADYTFDTHFGRPIPSYPPREVLKDYIMGRIDKRRIFQNIQLDSPVRWVTYDDDTERFTVTVMNHRTGEQEEEVFDYVIVATGHFSTPNMPYFEGIEKFSGRTLHAHDFRDALAFADQDVLLIGGSYSAEDIGTQCYKYGAKSVSISHRGDSLGITWPEGMEERPLVTRFDEEGAHFSDSSYKRFDSIVFCTGYLFHFPFLPDELRLQTHNRLYPDNLYKGIFFQPNPKLMYLGMQDQYFTFNMFDSQAWFVRDVLLGRIPLPDAATRAADIKKWISREEALCNPEAEIDFQADYVRDLLNQSDYPDCPIEQQAELLKSWLRDKQESIMDYRNKSYRSTITGTLAAQLPKPWLEIKDDSLDSFMRLEFVEAE